MNIMYRDVLNNDFYNIHREKNVVERECNTNDKMKHKYKSNFTHTELMSSDEITYMPKKKKKKYHRHKEENGQVFINKYNQHVIKKEPKPHDAFEQKPNKSVESLKVGKQLKNNIKCVETSASEIDTPVKKKKKNHNNKEEDLNFKSNINKVRNNSFSSDCSSHVKKKKKKHNNKEEDLNLKLSIDKIRSNSFSSDCSTPVKKKKHINKEEDLNLKSNIDKVRNNSFSSDCSTPVKKKKKLHKNNEANLEKLRNDFFNSDLGTSDKKKSHNDVETNLKSNTDLFKDKKFYSTDSNINKVRNNSFNSDSNTPVKRKKKSHKKDEYIDSPKETKLFQNSNGLDPNVKEVNKQHLTSLDESFDSDVTTPVKEKGNLHKNIYTTTLKDSNSDMNTATKKKKKHQDNSKIILKYEYTSSDTDNDCYSEKVTKKHKEQYCNGGDSFEGDINRINIQNHSHASTQNVSIHKQNRSKINKHQNKPLLENSSILENTIKQESLNGDSSLDYDAITDLLQLSDNSRLSGQQQEMLKQLTVVLPWPVHESHLIETRMSTHPSKEQQKQFKELGFNMKTDHYTDEEDARIMKNWKKFCELHEIPKDPQPFMAFELFRNSKVKGSVLPKKERINFVRFLGHRLPHRCLFSIYRRFKKLYSVEKKGKFSTFEDATILNYVKNCPDTNKFAQLAIVLKRDRHAILLRYKLLCKKLVDSPR